MIEPYNLNLRHLDGAVAVAALGGIGSAATSVNLSQPALTQALAKLERLLGQTLFHRQHGGTKATEAGGKFLDRARRALDEVRTSMRVIRRSARLPALPFPERAVSMTQLRALSAVERAGSAAAAARAIGLAQPSIYRAARELELVVGAPLLVQVGQRMRPTAAGERMVRGIRLAFAELRAGLDELAAIEREGSGRIRIGTLPLPRSSLLPAALARFAPTHLHAEITVTEGPYPELLAALRGGDIDLLLGALRDPEPEGVVQRALFEDDLFVVARANHPLASGTPSRAALAAFPWIVGAQGAPMRAVWDRLFASAVLPVSRIECGSVLTTRGLLLRGDWLALMSIDQFRLECEAGLLATIGGSIAGSRRRIGVAMRTGWVATATQAALLDALTAVGRERE